MEAQGIFPFARRQTKGAAYSTFYFYLSVPVRHTNLCLSCCITAVIFKNTVCLSVTLQLMTSQDSVFAGGLSIKKAESNYYYVFHHAHVKQATRQRWGAIFLLEKLFFHHVDVL